MSMYIKFQIRGGKVLVEKRFDYVPRVGETITYNDTVWDVVSVDYDLSTNSITVEIKH